MDRSSPARTAGKVSREVTLGGVKYVLSEPDKVRRAADEEMLVVARRLDMLGPLMQSCELLPEKSRGEARQQYIQAMICGIASPEEWRAYYRSPWQTAFKLWNALAPAHKKDKTFLEGVAWAYEVINDSATTQDEMDSLSLAIRIVSQEDALKNSSGSQETADTPAMDTLSTEAGPASTPSS